MILKCGLKICANEDVRLAVNILQTPEVVHIPAPNISTNLLCAK